MLNTPPPHIHINVLSIFNLSLSELLQPAIVTRDWLNSTYFETVRPPAVGTFLNVLTFFEDLCGTIWLFLVAWAWYRILFDYDHVLRVRAARERGVSPANGILKFRKWIHRQKWRMLAIFYLALLSIFTDWKGE
jgi:hypothetical protein